MAGWKERGMATAEYATGIVGAMVMATILYRVTDDGWFFDQMVDIFDKVRTLLPSLSPKPDWRWPWFM